MSEEAKRKSYINSLETFLTELQELPNEISTNRPPTRKNQTEQHLMDAINDCFQKLLYCGTSECTLSDKDIAKLKELQSAIDKLLAKPLKLRNQPVAPKKNERESDRAGAGGKLFKSEITCPCCYSKKEDNKALFFHLEQECIVLRHNNYTEPTGYTTFQIVPTGLKCNLCNDDIETYERKVNHVYSSSHKENKSKGSGPNALDTVLFCSVCRHMVPDSEIQFLEHISCNLHKQLSNNHRRKLISSNIAFILFQSELRCILCRKTVKMGELLTHTQNTVHNKQLTSNPECKSVWCPSCEEDIVITRAAVHEKYPSHHQNSKKKFICPFCEEECAGSENIIKHFKEECLIIKDLRVRWANLGNNNDTKQSTQQMPTTTTVTEVLIQGLKASKTTKLQVYLNLDGKFEGYDIKEVDADTLKVTFQSADHAKEVLANPSLYGDHLTIKPFK